MLRVRDFRWLWTAQTISTVGDQVFPIAATVTVLNGGGSAADLGLVLGARWLAIVLFSLIGGVWADRLPRRLVMMAADLFRAAVIGCLALLTFTPPVWALALLVFLVAGLHHVSWAYAVNSVTFWGHWSPSNGGLVTQEKPRGYWGWASS